MNQGHQKSKIYALCEKVQQNAKRFCPLGSARLRPHMLNIPKMKPFSEPFRMKNILYLIRECLRRHILVRYTFERIANLSYRIIR